MLFNLAVGTLFDGIDVTRGEDRTRKLAKVVLKEQFQEFFGDILELRIYAPNGIRTRVLALKGPRPSPLDDRDKLGHYNQFSSNVKYFLSNQKNIKQFSNGRPWDMGPVLRRRRESACTQELVEPRL